MRTIPFLALASAALLIAATPPNLPVDATDAAPLADDAPPPQTLDIGADQYSRMTVPVTIEGQGPFRFMIDTGAQATVVTRGLSDRLGLKSLGHATVVGMASRRQVDLVQLDGLEFAARVFDALHAPLLEADHIGADGILGLDSLQDLRVLIDFRTDQIEVGDAAQLGGNHGYEIVVRARNKLGRLIITDADIDGIRTAVIIDTGSQGSMGNLALRNRLRSRDRGKITATDVNGVGITGTFDFARSIRIDRLQLNAIPIAYADAPAFAALGLAKRPALVLGIEDLRLFDRVAIDFAARKVLFDLPADAMSGDGVDREYGATRL
jgi:predicted aspartyl protease